MTIEEFIERVSQRELPLNPMGRVKTLARELAEGVSYNLWFMSLFTYRGRKDEDVNKPVGRWLILDESDAAMQAYINRRWGDDNYPNLELLLVNGYLEGDDPALAFITGKAFELMTDVEPARIFISYKRSDSSAFALLVNKELKSAGLHPFLDMALVPGENWEAGLQERIQKSDYLIVLLGKETLKSEVTMKEIGWALDAGVKVIPIWHNGFTYKSGTWNNIPVRIDKALALTHTIRVVEENPLAYNTAMTELLNRFGITP